MDNERKHSLLEFIYSICYSIINTSNTGECMTNYIYLILVLIACLLSATAILYEQLTDADKELRDKAEQIERELNQ